MLESGQRAHFSDKIAMHSLVSIEPLGRTGWTDFKIDPASRQKTGLWVSAQGAAKNLPDGSANIVKTLETVKKLRDLSSTPLKRGVNETEPFFSSAPWLTLVRRHSCSERYRKRFKRTGFHEMNPVARQLWWLRRRP